MRTLASLACWATQSVETRTSATADSFRETPHLIWTPSAAHPLREGVVRARRALIPPPHVGRRDRFQVLPLNRAGDGLAVLGGDVPDALPHEQELPVALKEQLLVED